MGRAGKTHSAIEEKLQARKIFRVENARRLEGLIGRSTRPEFDLLSAGRFIYLEPILNGRQMLPVMSIRSNFKPSPPKVRLEVGLFLLDSRDELCAVGWRFETPEGSTGRHRYHHAQLFTAFHKQEAYRLPLCPDWIPIEQPALLLKADDPVTLLMNLVVSVYGYDRLKDVNAGVGGNILKAYMGRVAP